MSGKVKVEMKQVKETKGAFQYAEVDEDRKIIDDFREVKIGSMYLRKDALDGEKAPKFITVIAKW